ncbi:MAG TPA: hypothetical protein VL793_12235, partial [Patescibacteria group bacterium]|nr:hypothetical protein [Patescibacteria group bacterium]
MKPPEPQPLSTLTVETVERSAHASATGNANQPLRVLIVEDSENDALLLEIELQRAGYEPVCERVETRDA